MNSGGKYLMHNKYDLQYNTITCILNFQNHIHYLIKSPSFMKLQNWPVSGNFPDFGKFLTEVFNKESIPQDK